MQRSGVANLTVGDWAVVKNKVPNCGEQLQTAQVVAATSDKLTVLPQGEFSPREVLRESVESYQAVYGTATPQAGAKPIVDLSLTIR